MLFQKDTEKRDKQDKQDKGKRFAHTSSQGMLPLLSVYVDRQTGVNYLVASAGTEGVGVTVMLDAEGKPVVTPLPDEEGR